MICLSILIAGSCKTTPEIQYVYVEPEDIIKTIVTPLPDFPINDLILTPTTKEDYRNNYLTFKEYSELLEQWIVDNHPELIDEGPNE